MARTVCSVLAIATLTGCSSGPPQRASEQPAPRPSHREPAAAPAADCPASLRARRVNDWCGQCGVGYVAGVAIKSEFLFHALDAHGHDIDLKTIDCPVCLKEMEVDGYCAWCKIGWVRGQAYFSRLTHHLGRAESIEPSRLSCRRCRENAETVGWCDECGVGMVGNFAIRDKSQYASAEQEYRRLLAVVRESQRCERCAVAMLTDTSCHDCKRSFRDGRPRPYKRGP